LPAPAIADRVVVAFGLGDDLAPARGKNGFVNGARGVDADPEGEALAALGRADRDAALAILMRAYGTSLYRYCREMVADQDMADDVHQMTFVQAYESLPRFARRSSLRTWLFGIARHRCLDVLKMDRRRRRRFETMEQMPDHPEPGKTLEERIVDRSLVDALEICLRKLAPRIREAVLLRFQQGLSYPEIARLSGESAATLQARVARALPVLRRCIEEQGAAL